MNFFDIFGFKIKQQPKEEIPAVVGPTNDGSIVIENTGFAAAGFQSFALDIDAVVKSENDQILRYRELAMSSEVDSAIHDIVNEAIVSDQDDSIVKLELDKLPVSTAIKQKFDECFEEVLNLLDFNLKGHDIFKTFYIDGRLRYHILFKDNDPLQGITELRQVDALKIKKIKNIVKRRTDAGVEVVDHIDEFYLYNDKGINDNSLVGIKLTVDSIAAVDSGIQDSKTGIILGHLQKAIKPANQLKMLEDAVVIYTLTRAPDRRIFYIDVGTLPKIKAEQYVTDMMNKFKNKLVYNPTTGEIVDGKRHTSMIEDFFLARRDGCFSLDTKVKLLDGRDVSIADLTTEFEAGKENWAYSVSPEGEIVPGLITWAGTTKKNAIVIDVHLDNGEVITCTPEHKFILRNGEKIEAQNLKDGFELSSFTGNTKVIELTVSPNQLDVGTLTIDGDNKHHDYHNFALTAGVFVMNSKGTEITTLQGSQSLISADFVDYFKQKLYQSLNVPISRMQPQDNFTLGRSSEITREELKFNKFITRLRLKFCGLFQQLLRIQLISKGVINPDEWEEIKSLIRYDFVRDNYFAELKDAEILNNRLMTLQAADAYAGKYYSKNWIMKNILQLDDEQIETMQEEMQVDNQQEMAQQAPQGNPQNPNSQQNSQEGQQ